MRLNHLKDRAAVRIRVPLSVQDQTITHIRECGDNGEEGFVAWSGTDHGNEVAVKSVIIPSGKVFRHYLSMRFSDEAIEYIADTILSKGEKLIAQVHSHPLEAFHSETDDQFPLVHRKGFLSIVVPYFGEHGFKEFRVYQYDQACQWIELDQRTIRKRFILEGIRKWSRLRSIKSLILAQENS